MAPLVIEYRRAERKLDRLPGLAAELVGLKVDIIVTHGTPGVRAAKRPLRSPSSSRQRVTRSEAGWSPASPNRGM